MMTSTFAAFAASEYANFKLTLDAEKHTYMSNKLVLRDGPVNAEIRISNGAVVPGERVQLGGRVDNQSSRDIDGVNIILNEVMFFKKKKQTKIRKVLELKHGKVDPFSVFPLSGFSFDVPSLAPTIITSLLTVKYR